MTSLTASEAAASALVASNATSLSRGPAAPDGDDHGGENHSHQTMLSARGPAEVWREAAPGMT